MLYALLLAFPLAFAQPQLKTENNQVVNFEEKESQALAENLAAAAEQEKDPKAKKLLTKISDQLKSSSTLKKVGRKIGKGSTFLAVHTMKPFMRASSFLTGFFEKPEKNKDVVGLYQFLINHKADLDPLVKESATPEEFAQMVALKVEDIILAKSAIITRDVLQSLLPGQEIPKDMNDLDLMSLDLGDLDLDNIDPNLVNNHPEYAELKPILGDLTKEDISEMIQVGGISREAEFEKLEKALPRIHEMAGSLLGQIIVPTAVISAVSAGLGSIYALPIVAADVGALISTLVCTKKGVDQKFEKDEDLKKFCSYVTNWASYELMKSRMKGYNSGKKLKPKYKVFMQKLKSKLKLKQKAKSAAEPDSSPTKQSQAQLF
jgi:hypothetical protein